jgi:hypothetical protein
MAGVALADIVAALTAFPGRGAGTNSERRAALWLSQELRRGERDVLIETFWSRPNWALAQAWHVGLAVAGSLVSVASAPIGGGIVIVALLAVIGDSLTGHSPGRRLTPERASQNVVSPPPAGSPPTTLVITANYDTGHMGLVHQRLLRRPARRLRNLLGPLAPGWVGWLVIFCLWVLVTAVLRDGGQSGKVLAAAQLVPTAGLVVAFALLLELGGSTFGPGANDNASGVAVAISLVRTLDVSRPRRIGVEVVLTGAADGSMLPLRGHLRRRRRELTPARTIVLGIAAAGRGRPRYWRSDGPLVPMRFLPRLGELSRKASTQSGTPLEPVRGRGISPALPARFSRLPAITIGCLDDLGLAPGSHLPGDVAAGLESGVPDRLLEMALTLVDAIDAGLPEPPSATGQTVRGATTS